MRKKIFQVMILCGLSASMNEAMAKESKPIPLDASPCHWACFKLAVDWKTSGAAKQGVECKSADCTGIYEGCYNDCKPK
ncbi:MAG: hypothetical protein KBD90_06760 [Alphaproteobacteria bacterium]|nr:hypothetical protein [Alphaproteobacteria bacterium]